MREDGNNHWNNNKMFSLSYFQLSKSDKKEFCFMDDTDQGFKTPGVCKLGWE